MVSEAFVPLATTVPIVWRVPSPFSHLLVDHWLAFKCHLLSKYIPDSPEVHS